MIENSSFPGLQRFTFFLNQVQTILDKAEGSENPALLIYRENIRTPFFMLEALTRVYKKIHGKKIFTNLNCSFKEIEDSLGSIDYYDGFDKEFSTKKNAPASIIGYFKDRKEALFTELNNTLADKKWIGKNQKRIRKIFKNLNKVSWLAETDDTSEVKKVYEKYISTLTDKFKTNTLHFNNIEEDLHELRRELRWLSIYPQAFRGLMQLKVSGQTPDVLKKYLTNEIITSPYNIIPDGSKLREHVMLDSNNFYALSWLISELGKLKDNGLRLIITEEALTKLLGIKQKKAEEIAHAICEETQMSIPDILQRFENITTLFFEEGILESLVC